MMLTDKKPGKSQASHSGSCSRPKHIMMLSHASVTKNLYI